MSTNLRKLPFIPDLAVMSNASLFIHQNYHRGSFYKLDIPFQNIFVVTNPEVLHHVLVKNEANYLKSKIYWGQLKAIVGNALGTLEGEDWLWMKRLQMPFFTHEKAKGYLPEVMRINKLYFDRWERAYHEEGEDLIHAFSEMNLSAILKVIFGIDRVENCADIASYIADGEASIAYRSKFPWRPYTAWLTGHNRRAAGYLDFFDELTKTQIEQKQATAKTANDMLDELIAHSVFNTGKLSLQDIRNELIIHLGASTETAAVAEGWTLYLLHQHPKYLKEIYQEIDELAKGERIILEAYPKLQKTKRAIQEAMRLYPPSHAIIRDAQAEDKIDDVQIPKGSTMFVSAFGLHRNPEIWEDPDIFKPERFEQEEDFPKYTYIPFGAGRHTCIGRYLGLPQVVLSIAEFLRRFNFEIFNKELYPLSYSTLKPSESIRFKLTKRNPAK